MYAVAAAALAVADLERVANDAEGTGHAARIDGVRVVGSNHPVVAVW